MDKYRDLSSNYCEPVATCHLPRAWRLCETPRLQIPGHDFGTVKVRGSHPKLAQLARYRGADVSPASSTPSEVQLSEIGQLRFPPGRGPRHRPGLCPSVGHAAVYAPRTGHRRPGQPVALAGGIAYRR